MIILLTQYTIYLSLSHTHTCTFVPVYLKSFHIFISNLCNSHLDEFKYLGTTLTNQNSIQEEIKSRLKSGNACYHSVQSLLSSRLLSKNLKTKIYRTIILPVVLYAVKPGR